jgi:hypothetical protein
MLFGVNISYTCHINSTTLDFLNDTLNIKIILLVEWKLVRETEVLREIIIIFPPQIPHYLTRDGTRTAAVGSRRLAVWAAYSVMQYQVGASAPCRYSNSLVHRKEEQFLFHSGRVIRRLSVNICVAVLWEISEEQSFNIRNIFLLSHSHDPFVKVMLLNKYTIMLIIIWIHNNRRQTLQYL